MPSTTMQSGAGAESSSLTLVFSLPPSGLRRNHEANRFARSTLKDAYSLTMWTEFIQSGEHARIGAERQRGALHAEVVWRQCGEGDVDNTLASLKPMFDNLGCAPATQAGANRYYLGIYESDSQIKRICVARERVLKKSEECVLVSLSELAPAIDAAPSPA